MITNERWALALATFCFAGALLTKNEGSLFVLAVFLGLLAAAHTRWRALAVAAALDVLLLLPWRIYVHIHNLRDINYSLGDSFDYEPSARQARGRTDRVQDARRPDARSHSSGAC